VRLKSSIHIAPAGTGTNPSGGVVVCQFDAVKTAEVDSDAVLDVGSARVVRMASRMDCERSLAFD
jgi:hypothetical protein